MTDLPFSDTEQSPKTSREEFDALLIKRAREFYELEGAFSLLTTQYAQLTLKLMADRLEELTKK